ncbi:unnamed protein product [Rhizophagus irregularis]|nr:unnamed protein product [Rhizophagus irregularis]
MKFQLFLEELPTFGTLKRLRPDLYIDILTCRSCEDQLEDFMHCLCAKKRRVKLQQILNSYLRHLTSKITEAATGLLIVWFVAMYLQAFLDVFMELDIPRLSAMNVMPAIHNNFINKFRKWIWNPRSL